MEEICWLWGCMGDQYDWWRDSKSWSNRQFKSAWRYQWYADKVTIHPSFTGTVPVYERVSRSPNRTHLRCQNVQVSKSLLVGTNSQKTESVSAVSTYRAIVRNFACINENLLYSGHTVSERVVTSSITSVGCWLGYCVIIHLQVLLTYCF